MKRPRYRLAGAEAFKSNLKQKSPVLEPGEVFAVRKELSGGVTGEGDKPLSFTLSTSAVDRSGDTVSQDGWHLENYRKNPVILWAHDQSAFPVGKAPNVVIENGRLIARDVVWADHEDAKTVEDLYRGGFMSAVSVGFLPRKWAWNEERGQLAMDFQEQELLEFSAVPVPANPEALIGAKAAGINTAPVLRWAEKLLDGEGSSLVIPRALAEELWKYARPSRFTSVGKTDEAEGDDSPEPEPDQKPESDQAPEPDDLAEDKLVGALEALTLAVRENTAVVKQLQVLQTKAAPALPNLPAPDFRVTSSTQPSSGEIAKRVAAAVQQSLTTAVPGRTE